MVTEWRTLELQKIAHNSSAVGSAGSSSVAKQTIVFIGVFRERRWQDLRLHGNLRSPTKCNEELQKRGCALLGVFATRSCEFLSRWPIYWHD
jgi:hypothetical protein